MAKSLLTLEQLTEEELLDILNLADQLKFQRKNGIFASKRSKTP